MRIILDGLRRRQQKLFRRNNLLNALKFHGNKLLICSRLIGLSQVEIIKDLPEDKTITVYRCGPLVDLCRGPHILNTSFVKVLACTKASSAYWRGDKDRESLQRVYGISFPDQKQLKVWSPNMYNMQLWETSGHAANYKIEKQEFVLKPMNCPGHCLIFDHRVRSYRELPLRLADFGVLHRNEASGALTGLTRVRRFQQDDAHIFGRESQRPEKYLGDLESWEKAETALAEALNEFRKYWEETGGLGGRSGGAVFLFVYGNLRSMKEMEHFTVQKLISFQCATLQLDFQLPQQFNLSYSAEDESKRERPVMIHRAILGSVEHMFAILLEHFKGKWPFWLSPRQVMVFPVSDKSQSYALELRQRIYDAGYYVDVDTSDRTIQKKVREAQMAGYNYILVVGEAEASSGQVSVRVRSKPDHQVVTVDGLLTHFKDLVASFQ